MRRFFALLTAVAMVVSFLPIVEAADTAQLTISTSFIDLDIVRIEEISGELDSISADAEGIYTTAIASNDINIIKAAIEDLQEMTDHIKLMLLVELDAILLRRPDLAVRINAAVDKADGVYGVIAGYIGELTALLPQLSIWSDPRGPFTVRATEMLEFVVIAEDLDAINITINDIQVPNGAVLIEGPFANGRREVMFEWIPSEANTTDNGIEGAHIVIFEAVNDAGEREQLEIAITVLPAMVIAVDLNKANWAITSLPFGEVVMNESPTPDGIYQAEHEAISGSNVPIGIEIGYGTWQGYDPGPNGPGDGVFAVKLFEDGFTGGVYLPVPDTATGNSGMVSLITSLEPGASKQIPLGLYAPTKGDPDVGLSVVLAIRAYAATE